MQGPRLYRFFNYEQQEYIPAPTDGWNPDANMWELPSSQAPQLDNFLLHPGKLVMRGPAVVWSDMSGILNPANVCGWADYSVNNPTGLSWVLSSKIPSSTAFVDHWNVPLIQPAAATQLALAQSTTGILIAPNGTAAANGTSTHPGPRSIYFDGWVYFITYDWSSHSFGNGSQGSYAIWDTRLVGLSNGTQLICPNAPTGAFDLAGYQSRIWLLGGTDTPAALTTHEPCTLYFSNPGTAGIGNSVTDWQDPVTGETNKIKMDNNVDDFGVALAQVRNGLLILRRNSVWLLRGSTTANYALVSVSKEFGCVDARSVIETDAGVYFMSSQGLMLTNGTTVVNVSGTVMRTLQTAIAVEQKNVIAGQGGYISCGTLSTGAVVVSIGLTTLSGHIQPLLAALYDPVAVKGGAWTRLTSQLWASDGTQVGTNYYPGQLIRRPGKHQLYAVGDKYFTALEDTGLGVSISVPTIGGGGLYDKLPSGASPYLSIPAVWQSIVPAVTTAAKRTFGQAKRYYIDYMFAAQSLQSAGGWQMQPFDGTNAALDTAQQVPAGAPPTLTGFVSGVSPAPNNIIYRLNRDLFDEIGDMYFVVSWSDSARAAQAPAALAELYGVGLEFQHARERR